MNTITQKEINEQVERIKGRGERGANIIRKRIERQMGDQGAIINEAQLELASLERELTVHLIAMDAAGIKES